MNTLVLCPRRHLVNVNRLIPISITICQRLAKRAGLNQIDIDFRRADFSGAIAQSMEPLKQVGDLEISHSAFILSQGPGEQYQSRAWPMAKDRNREIMTLFRRGVVFCVSPVPAVQFHR
jgi:hypothetical protein